MRLLCLVTLLLLTVGGLGEGEGGHVEPSEGIEGVDDKVVVEEEEEEGEEVKVEEWEEDKVGEDLAKDSSILEDNIDETADLKKSKSEEEEETSESTSAFPSSSQGEGERDLEGSDDKSVVDEKEDPPNLEREDPPTPTEKDEGGDPPPTSASEGPCLVCSCSTLDNMGDSMKMNNKMIETWNETIQIDCSQLDLSTWIPMQGASLAVDFSHNLLTTLPTFSQEGMVSLDLSYNQIALLPPLQLAHLASSLVNLNLAGNKLARSGLSDDSLQMDPVQHLSRPWILETLSLADNRLHSLPADIFGQLGSLQILDLSSNPLSEMDAATIQAIGGIASLLSLSLADCRLASLSHGLLDGLIQLETLDLSGNPLTMVDPRLRSAPSITSLVLDRSYILLHVSSNFAFLCSLILFSFLQL